MPELHTVMQSRRWVNNQMAGRSGRSVVMSVRAAGGPGRSGIWVTGRGRVRGVAGL